MNVTEPINCTECDGTGQSELDVVESGQGDRYWERSGICQLCKGERRMSPERLDWLIRKRAQEKNPDTGPLTAIGCLVSFGAAVSGVAYWFFTNSAFGALSLSSVLRLELDT